MDTEYQNKHCNTDQNDEGTLDDRRRDGGTNFILRIKEQETRQLFMNMMTMWRVRVTIVTMERQQFWNYECVCVCVSIFGSVNRHAYLISFALLLGHILLPVWLWHNFPHYPKRYDFRKKKFIECEIGVLIFSRTVDWNFSHSKENSARYHKCPYIFM